MGSNPIEGMDAYLLLSVVCCQVEVSATGRSLVQSSPSDCGALGRSVTKKGEGGAFNNGYVTPLKYENSSYIVKEDGRV